MTEYELLSIQAQRAGNLIELSNAGYMGFTIFITIVSAYLAAAYVAGDKLTRPQVVIANATYLVGATVMVSMQIGSFQAFRTIKGNAAATWREYGQVELAQRFESTGLGLLDIAWPALMVTGIFVPLYFMWSIRHPKTE
jgi:hypothetical protein